MPDPNYPVKPTKGRIVLVNTPDGVDGGTEHVALVTKVNDNGTINAVCFPENGGAPFSQANLGEEGDTMAFWAWPKRV